MSVDVEDVAMDALTNAKVIPLLPPGIPIIFSYNPAKVSITRGVMSKQTGKNDGSAPTWKASTPRTLTCEAHLEGPQTHTLAQQLIETMNPKGGLLGTIMALAGVNLMRR